MSHRRRVAARVLLAGLIALTGGMLGVRPAAGAVAYEYAKWDVSGKAGTVSMPGGGFPSGTVDSTSSTLRAGSGKSTFLNASTPVGREFGTSAGHNYLSFGADGKKPSVNTITFDKPAPDKDWAFVLGDVDAEKLTITATGEDGTELTPAELGWQGGFNYCAATPRPSSCTRKVYTDDPVWDPAASTLTGNGTDTDGASGWFKPTRPVKSLKVELAVLTGIPIVQLWIVQNREVDENKPMILITEHVTPGDAAPGDPVSFTITVVNDESFPRPEVVFIDDLSGVLDDAELSGKPHANGGTVELEGPDLIWHGPLRPGQMDTISFSVILDNPTRGDGLLVSTIIGEGFGTSCHHGKGRGCVETIRVLPGGPATGLGGMAGSVSRHHP